MGRGERRSRGAILVGGGLESGGGDVGCLHLHRRRRQREIGLVGALLDETGATTRLVATGPRVGASLRLQANVNVARQPMAAPGLNAQL